MLFFYKIVAFRLELHVCPADGESTDDWHRRMGKVVWSGLQLPGCRRRDRCGSLPVLCGPGRPHRGNEASSSPALLCILQTTHTMAVLTISSTTDIV